MTKHRQLPITLDEKIKGSIVMEAPVLESLLVRLIVAQRLWKMLEFDLLACTTRPLYIRMKGMYV